jgi:hypothetical protein
MNQMTAIDDVRRVRERFSREANGDVRKLAEQSRQAFEQFREKLGLKLVNLTESKTSRDAKAE